MIGTEVPRVLCLVGALSTLSLALLVGGGASAMAPARPAATVVIPVVRCSTTFGVPPGTVKVPSHLRVSGAPSGSAGLAAYTNTEEFLVGPADWQCRGQLGADGNGEIVAWPHGQTRPSQHSRGDGLSLAVIPSCVGCQASEACPFFTSFAKALGFPCAGRIPPSEKVDRIDARVVRFRDPAGLAGDGYPSGGPDTAMGVVGVFGHLQPGPYERSVYRSTCTLPASKRSICLRSLDDVIHRYG